MRSPFLGALSVDAGRPGHDGEEGGGRDDESADRQNVLHDDASAGFDGLIVLQGACCMERMDDAGMIRSHMLLGITA